MIDDATVRHVARLARLHLEPDEERRMVDELSGSSSTSTPSRRSTSTTCRRRPTCWRFENVMRDDEPRPSLPVEEALREAPRVVEDRFAVVKFDA